MKETEITVQVFDSYQSIHAILTEKGFKLEETYELCDLYFTKFKDVKGMSYPLLMKNSFILRKHTSGGKEVTYLCYKNKEIDEGGVVVSEEKTQTTIASQEDAAKALKLAGLNNYCTVVNNSFVYGNGEMCFAVQVIKDLGIFIEYEEDEKMAELPAKEKISMLKQRILSLGLNFGEDFSCKKIFMLVSKILP